MNNRVGQSALVRCGRGTTVMIVQREELGWVYCRSGDLQTVAKYPIDAWDREQVAQGKVPSEVPA